MSTKARLPLSALICLAFSSPPVQAIGFGEIVSQSAIGEPFRALVRLHGVKSDEGGECLRLAPGPGLEGIPELRDAQIGLRQVNGNWVAVVTRSTPVFDPVIRMTLEETCSARLQRAYTLLLPMPAEFVAPIAGTAFPSPTLAPAPSASRGANAPFGTDTFGGTWTLTEASSINALARTLYPSSRVDRQAFASAARSANAADRSIRSARQKLAAGTTLVIPSIEQIEAARERIERNRRAAAAARAAPQEQTPAPRTEPREAPPAANESRTVADGTQAEAAPRGDRLMIMGDAPDTSGFKLSLQLGDPGLVERTTESEREQLRREQQFVMALDSQIIAQLELRDRIARLQALQDSLNAELEAQQGGARGEGAGSPEPAAAASSYPDDAGGLTGQAVETDAPVVAAVPPAPQPAEVTLPAEASTQANLLDTLIAWWRPLAVGALLLLLGLLWWRKRQTHQIDEDELEALASFSGRADAEAEAASEAIENPDRARQTSAAARAGESDSFDFSTTDWSGPPPAELDHSVAPITIEEDHLTEEHASAVELADIMMSFGRVHGAAETLSDFIRGNPTQAVQPWIKLLEVYRAADMKAEFEGLTRQLNKIFNVKIISWEDFEKTVKTLGSIEEMPHIARTLQSCWGTPDCQAYIHGLLRDTRGGTRQGFPLGVIDELLLLLAVLEDSLGPYRAANVSSAAVAPAVAGAAAAHAQNEHAEPPLPQGASVASDEELPDPDSVGTESYLPDLDFDVESPSDTQRADEDDAEIVSANPGVTGLDFHLDSDADASSPFADMEANEEGASSARDARSTGIDFDLESDSTASHANLSNLDPSEEEENSVSRTFVQTNVDYRIGEGDAPDDDDDEADDRHGKRQQR